MLADPAIQSRLPLGRNKQIPIYLSILFQNGPHFSILLFPCKLALLASLSNVNFKRIFNLERGKKGQFTIKQKNTKMAAILK